MMGTGFVVFAFVIAIVIIESGFWAYRKHLERKLFERIKEIDYQCDKYLENKRKSNS